MCRKDIRFGAATAPLRQHYINDLGWVWGPLGRLYGTFTLALHQRLGLGFGAFTVPLRWLHINDLEWVLGPVWRLYGTFTPAVHNAKDLGRVLEQRFGMGFGPLPRLYPRYINDLIRLAFGPFMAPLHQLYTNDLAWCLWHAFTAP